MTKWLSGIRGAILMIVMWTVGWGLGFGGLAELFVDPDGEHLDLSPMEMTIPGFIGGIVFAILVRIADGHRHFDDISIARLTIWGVVTGLVLAALSITTDGPIPPLSLTDAELIGIATALGAVSGFGSAVFFHLVTQGPRLTLGDRTS